MKKLSLGKLKLLSEEVLQRSQLAKIYGGSEPGGSGPCVITCEGPNGTLHQARVPACSVGCIRGGGYFPIYCVCT